jgi:diphthine methyl ester acylhydrolase
MLKANLITDCPPDSIEWCPIQSDLFACGTYLYNPDNITREGSIYLFRYNTSTSSIDTVHHQQTNGILDLKWISCSPESTFLSTVSALGQLSLYSLADLNRPIVCEDVTNDRTIALSHAWLQASNNYAVISDQQGCLSICDLDSSNGLRFSQSWSAHDYECWTCAWDQFDSNIVYSGADDNLMKIWDIRNYQQAIHINRKHTMGICSIVSDDRNDQQFFTGSFDEYLRLWDKRQLNEPLKMIKLGGGVWKIKPYPNNKDILLCACMQNGFVIVDMKTSTIQCHYQQHGSLAYGCDWQRMDSVNQLTDLLDDCMNVESNENHTNSFDCLIASCSFYDKTIHVWQQAI